MLIYTGRLRDKSRKRGRGYVMILRKVMIAAAAVAFVGAMAASTATDARTVGFGGGGGGFRADGSVCAACSSERVLRRGAFVGQSVPTLRKANSKSGVTSTRWTRLADERP